MKRLSGKCDFCGLEREVFYASDPYDDEVHPNEPKRFNFWCEECYDSRHADV